MSLAKDMTQLREELNNSREKRKAFISELSSEVSQFLKNSRDVNNSFACNLRQTVGDLMKEYANDLADARSLWNNVSTEKVSQKAVPQKSKKSKTE